MLKNIFLIIFLLLSTFAYSANDYDKNIIVKNQTRNEKVKSVFKELMKYYEEEDEAGFFSLVSEDRFLQDFMLFEQAIEKDFRTYEILDFEYWIDKITSDGVKRYLYVKWEKRYELIDGNNELVQRGYSRFLFDEINGKYKLIEVAGNNLWGNSLSEWKEEVPSIAGEEKNSKTISSNSEQSSSSEEEQSSSSEEEQSSSSEEEQSSSSIEEQSSSSEEEQSSSSEEEQSSSSNGQPDLVVIDVSCTEDPYAIITFRIKNQGTEDTNAGSISWSALNGDNIGNGSYSGDLSAGETSPTLFWNDSQNICSGGGVIVDPENSIEESDENNNESDFSAGSPTADYNPLIAK